MKEIKLKRLSLATLLGGYLLGISFIVLVILGMKKDEEIFVDKPEIVEINNTIVEEKIVYVDREVFVPSEVTYDSGVIYKDRLSGVVLNDDTVHTVVKGQSPEIFLHEDDDLVVYNNDRAFGVSETITNGGRDEYRIHNRNNISNNDNSANVVERLHGDVNDIDPGLLDRRLRDGDLSEDHTIRDNVQEKIGLDKDNGIDLGKLTISRDGDENELGDVLGDVDLNFDEKSEGYGVGKGGELYAYNFPSQGVGAGVGSSAVGAGAGGGAGLGAGIGEGILDGEIVPTLGGIGDGAKNEYGEPAAPSGVGGLVGGAGAGGAAGLVQGYITEKLGVGVGVGIGQGSGGGKGGRYNYDHLPKDGALHIMMHVDGSGSILNTRKQLDIMKDTLLKKALLPYYNNDEGLYNRRVTIVDGNGERTLQFFTEAAKKDNVLAIVFQDEGAPSYHLPTFNKKPQDHYSEDMNKLKASLNGYGGVYRGLMFQVDRGKTFAKSFKEFVGNAFKGEGYLKSVNLKKYHKDNNNNHIRNKDGVVFNDEYHAKDSGDPEYYLNLIFNASKKIGLDLNIYGAGLTDGRKTNRE